MNQAEMESIAQIASLVNAQDNDFESPPQSPQSQQQNSASGGAKRKAEDGHQPQQRAKRNRYISIACNECKRRKIKCNGQTPCQRCGNLNLECVYAPNCCNGFKDSQEFKDISAHVSSLQEQVNGLYEDLNNLRAQMGGGVPQPITQQQQQQLQAAIDPSLQTPYSSQHRPSWPGTQASPGSVAPVPSMSPSAVQRPKSQSQTNQPSFRGPTSNAFSLGVARNSLQTMGITSRADHSGGDNNNGTGGSDDASREASPRPLKHLGQVLQHMHEDKDPIWSVSQDEALRLCRVWEDEMGMMYPVLDMDKITAYVRKLYRFMEAAYRTGLMQQGFSGSDSIEDEDTNILKMVLASAMTVEASGKSELGRRMFEYVHPAIDNLLLGKVGTKGIRLLILTAMYEFHRDNEGTAWRIIGLTARLCIELGLHRRETYEAMQDESERDETILLFWSIYVLDRRWSFGTGMPFALQDQDIDPLLPKPEERSPYLSAMIQYCAIGAKVWRSVVSTTSGTGAPINTEEMGYLDYQIIQWHRSVPPNLRFEHPSQSGRLSTPIGPPPSRAAHRLRIMLYLRANQMRILIYRPVLHSATSILQHKEQAYTAIDVAKDSIRVLTHINQTSDLYRTQQVLFNAFLTSALAVLFLAVAHTPAEFAESVREEFYMALELVRGFSKGSWISKRLWKTIRVLKEVGPKLGLVARDNDTTHNGNAAQGQDDMDPSRSAAVAMAGLAGHNVDEMALYPQQWSSRTTGASSSPENMADDLTSLFEAAGGYQPIGSNGGSGVASAVYGAINGGVGPENGDGSAAFGDESALAGILKELF